MTPLLTLDSFLDLEAEQVQHLQACWVQPSRAHVRINAPHLVSELSRQSGRKGDSSHGKTKALDL